MASRTRRGVGLRVCAILTLLLGFLMPTLSFNLPHLPPSPQNALQRLLVPAFLSTSLIFSPPPLLYTSSLPTFGTLTPPVYAKELASGSGSRVNKDAESLLRYGLPGVTKEARQLQLHVESTKGDLASKR